MINETRTPADDTVALLPKSLPSSSQAAPPRDRYTRTTSRAGYYYMLLSTIGFGAMILLLRVAVSNLHLSPARALLLRTGVQTLLSAAILLYQAITRPFSRPSASNPAATATPTGTDADAAPPQNQKQQQQQQPLILPRGALLWLMLRGSLGAVALFLQTSSLARIPAGDATAIFFTVPVFTMFFSYVLVGEQVTRVDGYSAALSLLGGMLVGAPDSTTGAVRAGVVPMRDRVTGSLMSFAAAILSGLSYTVVRKLGSSIHFLHSVFALGACGGALAVASGGAFNPLAVLLWPVATMGGDDGAAAGTFRLAVATATASALGGFVGQCTLSRGLQLSKAGPAILMRNLDVPVVYAVSIAGLGEVPNTVRTIGATLVVASAVVMALQKVK